MTEFATAAGGSRDRIALARDLLEKTDGDSLANPRVPSGYTYLGQLIAHDLTRASNDRGAANQPALDLGCLYANGPVNATDAKLYDGVRLKIGRARRIVGDGESPGAARDVPIVDGERLLADRRNDENLIVSQLTVLIAKLHNFVVAEISRQSARSARDDYHAFVSLRQQNTLNGLPGRNQILFGMARSLVTRIYHRLVTEEFAPLLLDTNCASRSALDMSATERLLLPFGAYALRACHAMVRSEYAYNDSHPETEFGTLRKQVGSTNRAEAIAEDWVIDWSRFFFSTQSIGPAQAIRRDLANYSLRLRPEYEFVVNKVTKGRRMMGLIDLDDLRVREIGCVSGQEVASAIYANGKKDNIRGARLTPSDIRSCIDLDRTSLSRQQLADFSQNTPLLFYLQCEAAAKAQGMKFGIVGSILISNLIRFAIDNCAPMHPDIDDWIEAFHIPNSMREITSVCW